jgi:hypothetical protein
MKPAVGGMLLAVALAACQVDRSDAGAADAVAGSGTPSTTSTTVPSRPTEDFAPGELPGGPSALLDMNDPSFPPPLVDPREIVSGGPPPDGIPPIDAPRFVGVTDADQWLDDRESVVYLRVGDEAHAYPSQVLIWHEIVNDTVGGVPVAVTYCPLCNSAVSYRREINGVVTTFGTSGRLYASALVMYDRATGSLWTHFDGRAVVGVLAGETLERIPSPLLAWGDFKAAFPDGLVLDRDRTGYDRDYGRNPYVGYDTPTATPFLFRGTVDDRALAMQRVVGVAQGGVARAWTLDSISGGEAQATNTRIGDTQLVILWKAGQASAVDHFNVADGRGVGSVGVFIPVVDGSTLVMEERGGRFYDSATGSEWDITGEAVAGPLQGEVLEQVHHLDTFWFAWSTYQPRTDLLGG